MSALEQFQYSNALDSLMIKWRKLQDPAVTNAEYNRMYSQMYKVLHGCANGVMTKNEARNIIRQELGIRISFDRKQPVTRRVLEAVTPKTKNQLKRERRKR